MQAAAAPQALGKHCRQLGVGQIEPGQGAILQIYISLKGAVAQTQWHRHGLAHQVQRFNDPCTSNVQPFGRGSAIFGAQQQLPDQPGADGVSGSALCWSYVTYS